MSRKKPSGARDLLLNVKWGWSVQVAGEFFYTATSHKRPFRLSTYRATEYLLSFPTAPLTSLTVLRALDIQQRFQLSYWDASIVAAASELGCGIIYTEDLNHGQDYDGVKALNPFLTG